MTGLPTQPVSVLVEVRLLSTDNTSLCSAKWSSLLLGYAGCPGRHVPPQLPEVKGKRALELTMMTLAYVRELMVVTTHHSSVARCCAACAAHCDNVRQVVLCSQLWLLQHGTVNIWMCSTILYAVTVHADVLLL